MDPQTWAVAPGMIAGRYVVACALLLALVASACPAAAQTRYVIRQAIGEHLTRTDDNPALCRKRGMSMKPLVLFIPPGSAGLSVYWDRATDLFVQYPGFSGCTVWRRRAAVQAQQGS